MNETPITSVNMAVRDKSQKIAIIIMQIRQPLTLKLMTFIRHHHMLTMSKYKLHIAIAVFLPKMKIMISLLP